MTDQITAKHDNESPKGDSTIDPVSGAETKVTRGSAEPAAKPKGQPTPLPAVTKLKKGSATPRATRGNRRLGFVSTIARIVWSGPKFLGKIIWGLGKLTVWKIPCYAYRNYRGIKSKKLRRATALGAVLLIGVGAFFLWPALEQGISADTGKEACEFLARPAARLYVDGKLESQEVPPIFRIRLATGRHTVRFVSPENRSHEASIVVVRGKPTQWFMNFINDTLDERSLISKRENK